MTWLARLFRRNQMEEQLDKELRFHLEQHASDLRARGYSAGEAQKLARLAIGGPEQTKEKCRDARGTRWLEDFTRDVRYALRTFTRKPGFAAIVIMILALGIGATTIMFAVVDSVLLRPLPFPHSERLVAIHGYMKEFGEFWGFSYPDYADLKRDSHTLSIAAWTYSGGTISAPGEPEYVDGRLISADLFPTLGVEASPGRAFSQSEDHQGAAPVAIISHSLWLRRFAADPAIAGKTLVYDGKSYTIVGVAPAGFQLSGDADVFTPLGQNVDARTQNREAHFIHVVSRLRPSVDLTQARSEVALIAHQLEEQYPKSNKGLTMRVTPLLDELVGDVRKTLWLLLGAVALVLSIASANIASLLLTRAISRERELAMRVTLGAGWGRLCRQCLTESAVLGCLGGLLGIVIAKLGLRPFLVFWPDRLPRVQEIHLDWQVWAFAVGVSLVCALFFGIAPVLRVPSRDLEPTLRAGGRTVVGGSRGLRSAFVISEIALAFVLLIGAGMLGNTLLKLSSLDPGLNVNNVLTARFALSPSATADSKRIPAAWQDVLDRARRVPDVQYAALADIIPMREGENSLPYRTTAAPLPPSQQPFALATTVTSDYLKVTGIPLHEGRFVDDHDRADTQPIIVIDENLARHAFPGQSAVGKHLWIAAMGDTPVEVVGVVGHVRHWGLAGDDQSRVRDQIYYPFAQVPIPLLRFFSSVMSIAVRTKTAPMAALEPLRAELRGAAGDQAMYEPRTMEELVSASLARQRFLMLLFGVFAGTALLLAAVGVYGVLAQMTGERVPEIGVRIALGASIPNVIRMVMVESMRLVAVGLALGVVGALLSARVLQRAVEGMRPIQATTFAVMIPVLVLAALVASFLPAYRACRVDPVQALREQ